MQVKINRMCISKRAPSAGRITLFLGLCLIFAAAPMQGRAQSTAAGNSPSRRNRLDADFAAARLSAANPPVPQHDPMLNFIGPSARTD